jgi:two-component system sensor histidine kinase ResE
VFILKNIVAKLWMTIIALVAVVLLILGLFLFNYIDTSFPKSNDQSSSLKKLADKAAVQTYQHRYEANFVPRMNDLLSPQDSGLVMLNRDANVDKLALNAALFPSGEEKIKVGDVFSTADLTAVFSGNSIELRKFNYLFMAVPVKTKDMPATDITSILIVHQSEKSVESTQLYVKKLFVLVSLIGFLLTTFFAFFLITRITKPLHQLKKAADLISMGEYGSRVPIVSTDELGELARTFNLMGERLEETIKDLNHEKENLSSVLRSMADAVISFNVEGNVIFTNPHGEKIIANWRDIQWGVLDADEELVPSDDSETPTYSDVPHAKQIPEPLQQLFANVVEETKEITSKLNVHDGVWSVVIAPLYSRELVRGAVAVLRDVTEEHRLEKLRKDFVANVSHELRTPLSMLQGYSEALLDDIAASPEERRELAQVIYDESLRMGRLVKDLLDLARMETGHLELNFQRIHINTLFKRVHRKFSALCKDKGIQIVMECPDDGIVLTNADEDRLEQVLTNLLDNAIRHTLPGAKIMMRVGHYQNNDIPSVLIEIEDQGQGIPAADLPFIFERFYKADKARTRGSTTGTGLGLAIVKNIVDSHHGTVNVRSVVGQGTTFSIILPL